VDNDSAFAGVSDVFASLTGSPTPYFVIREFMKRRVLLMLVTHVLLAYSIYGQTSITASPRSSNPMAPAYPPLPTP
jgi:hypothetical protein